MSKRRLVIADDSPPLRRLLYALLTSDGRFEVVAEAEDGRQTLEQVERHAPEVLLLDLSMPVLDGIQVLQRLAMFDDPPVTVVLTGYADDLLREQVLAAGAAGCLEKGLDFGTLTDRLATITARVVAEEAG